MRVDNSPKLKFSSYKQETNTSNRTSHSLFSSYVVTTVKYRKLSWGGSTACIKAKRKEYRILVRKTPGETSKLESNSNKTNL